jgi:hypothetical protein
MPPIPYHYHVAEAVPRLEIGQSITTAAQLSIDLGMDSPHTTMTYRGPAEASEFEWYSVEHQVLRQAEAIHLRQKFGEFIEVKRFMAYYQRECGYFLVTVDRHTTRAMFERLRRAVPAVKASPRQVDLSRVEKIGLTTGGWFGKLQIADVRSSALFGSSSVTDSDEWTRYANLGELKALEMRAQGPEDDPRSIQLTRNRCVVLRAPIGERSDLEFVAYVQATIDAIT